MVKKEVPAPAPQVVTNAAISIPIIALVLGVTSLFMWFLGIPAIILGIIGMRKYSENRGFSITGLVTGIISTLLMICAIIFLIGIVVLGILNAGDAAHDLPDQPQDNYNDRMYRRYHEGI